MVDAALGPALQTNKDFFYSNGRAAADATLSLLVTPISRLVNNVLQIPGIQSDDLNYVLATLKRIENIRRYLALFYPHNEILDEIPAKDADNIEGVKDVVEKFSKQINEFLTLNPQEALAIALWTETHDETSFTTFVKNYLPFVQAASAAFGKGAPFMWLSLLIEATSKTLSVVNDVSQMWNTKMPPEFMNVVYGLPEDFPLKDTLLACFPSPDDDFSDASKVPTQRRLLNNFCTANVIMQLFGPLLGIENSGPAIAIMNLVAMSSFVQGFNHAMDSESSDYMCGSIADILRGQALNVALTKFVGKDVSMSTALNVPQLMCAVARNPVLLPGFKALSGDSYQTVYFGSNTYQIVGWGLPLLASLITASPLWSGNVLSFSFRGGGILAALGMLNIFGPSSQHKETLVAAGVNVVAGGITSLYRGGPESQARAQQAFHVFDQNMNAALVSAMFAGNIEFGSLPDDLLIYIPGFTKAAILHKVTSLDKKHEDDKGFKRYIEVERVIVIEGASYIFGSDLMSSSRDLVNVLETDPDLDIQEWCSENKLLCTIEDSKTNDEDRTIKGEKLLEELRNAVLVPTSNEKLLTRKNTLHGLAMLLIGGGVAAASHLMSKDDKLKLLHPEEVPRKTLFKQVLRDGHAPVMFECNTLFDFLEKAALLGESPDTITERIAQMTFDGGYGVEMDVGAYFALGPTQRSSFKPQLLTKKTKTLSTVKKKMNELKIDGVTEDEQIVEGGMMGAQGDTFQGPNADENDEFHDAIDPPEPLNADEIREFNRPTTQPFTVIEDPLYENNLLLKGWGFWTINIPKAIEYFREEYKKSPPNIYEKRRRLNNLRGVMLEDKRLQSSLLPIFLGTVQIFNGGIMPSINDMEKIIINSAKFHEGLDGASDNPQNELRSNMRAQGDTFYNPTEYDFDGDVCKYYSDNKHYFDKALEIHGRTCTMLADGVKIIALSPKDSDNAAPEIQQLVDKYEPGGNTLLGDIARGLISHAGLGGYQIPSDQPIDKDGLNTKNLHDANLKLAAYRDFNGAPLMVKEPQIRRFEERIEFYKDADKKFWKNEEKARLKQLAAGEEPWSDKLLRKVRGETLPSETLKLGGDNLVTENLADAERKKTLALRLSQRINGQISSADQDKIAKLERRIQDYKDADGKYLLAKEEERTSSDDTTQAGGEFGVLSTKPRMQGDTTVSESESLLHLTEGVPDIADDNNHFLEPEVPIGIEYLQEENDLGQLAHYIIELNAYISEQERESIQDLVFRLQDIIFDVMRLNETGVFTGINYVSDLDAIIREANSDAWYKQYIQAIAKQVKRVCINEGLTDQPRH